MPAAPTTQPTTLPADAGPVGKPMPRRDGRLKVTGGATYSAEWPVDDLAHAVAVDSTIARGRITSIDTKAAEKHPGVIAVMTHRNAPKMGEPKGAASTIVPVQATEIHHAGQYVAVVVGETIEAATRGAQLVKVTYDEWESYTDLIEHLDKAEPVGTQFGDPPIIEKGDAPSAFDAAAVKLDRTYVTPQNNHNPIEPHATIAHWHAPDAQGVTLTVYDASQNIHGYRGMLGSYFGIEPATVRVVCKFIGGAFGCKGAGWPHVGLAANTAKFVKRPVRLVLMREQMYGGVGGRTPAHQHIKMGAAQDGTFEAIVHDAVSSTARVDTYVEALTAPSKVLYAAPNRRLTTNIVRLDTQLPTYMRAPAEAASMFATEAAVDELAEQLGMDPIELRRRNEPEVDPTSGKPWSSRLMMRCFDDGAAAFGWKGSGEPRGKTDGRWRVGVGCAAATYPAHAMPAVARITLRADGTAEVASGTHEMGGGTTTAQAQNAARLLGLPVGAVTVILGDTRLPYAPVSGGSMTTPSVGGAIKAAAQVLKEQLLDLAQRDMGGPLSGKRPDDVSFKAGRLVLNDDDSKGAALTDLLTQSFRDAVTVDGRWAPPGGMNGSETSHHSFGATFCEVGVDEALGMVRVRRFVARYACGTILNAQTARSQFRGGIIFGIGQALLEHTSRDHRYGRITNDNLAEYHVPVNADVPEIDVDWIADPDYDASPIGAKGIGEIGITGVAGAIANAVYNATGKRLYELPILAEHVMRA